MSKISVIMPSYLSDFPGCAPNREMEFVRAVESFMRQTHKEKELIIISDGCSKTRAIYAMRWANKPQHNIMCLEIEKQPTFSGAVRQAGLNEATGDIVCYLDTDDIIEPTHLANIDACFTPNVDWVYFNSTFVLEEIGNRPVPLNAELDENHIGTGNIAHRRDVDAKWEGWIGAKENWFFIQQLIQKYPKRKKIYGCGYIITHAKVNKITKTQL